METINVTPKWEGLVRFMIAACREPQKNILVATWTVEITKLGTEATERFLQAIDPKSKPHMQSAAEEALINIARRVDFDNAKKESK